MDDIVIRHASVEDAAAIAVLAAAAERVDQTGEHYSTEDWVEELENTLIDPAKDWLLAERSGELIGMAMLSPRAPADGAQAVGVQGIVHPDHRGEGVGSTLVPLMIQRGRDHVAERGDLTPLLRAGAKSDDEAATSLLEAHGFRPHRWNFVMEADLTSGPAGNDPLPAGYEVSTWEGIDHDEIRASHNIAFADHPGWSKWDAEMWRQYVSESRAYRPALSLVARDEAGEIAAYVQVNDYEAMTEVTGKREAFIGKVGTVPAHRRRGLGSALLGNALDVARQAGYDQSALDVDSENPSGALRVYERAGFRVTLRFTLYEL